MVLFFDAIYKLGFLVFWKEKCLEEQKRIARSQAITEPPQPADTRG